MSDIGTDGWLCSKCGQPGKFETVRGKNGKTWKRRACYKCRRAHVDSWVERNKDYFRWHKAGYARAYRRDYFLKNPHKQPGSKAWGRANPEKFLFGAMQRRIRLKKGEKYELRMTFQEFLEEIGGKVPRFCPVLGLEMHISDKPHDEIMPTVDRIDHSRPYERGNVAIISWRANIIKSIGSADEHRKVADWMDKTKKSKG